MRMTPLQTWIARKVGRPDLPLDRRDLHRYQLERLQATVALARRRSRFYRELLAEVPEPLGSLAGLSRLPFTTARDVAERGKQ